MIRKWTITIPELSGDEPRNIYLYLPESYEWDLELRYPVLYMFDGHNVFFDADATYGKSWGMREYLEHTDTQIIVAAVECTHDPDHGRLSEYSPVSFCDPNFGSIEGRGQETMEWLIHTLKPELDRDYRTIRGREYTWIAGSSMGGLMSLYAVSRYNHVFSRAAALSPSLWVSKKKLKQLFRETDLTEDTVIYMDYGSEELRAHAKMAGPLFRTARLLEEMGASVTCRIVPGGTHCEASWERQIPIFMEILQYNR